MRVVRVERWWTRPRGALRPERLVLEGQRLLRSGESSGEVVRVEVGMTASDWEDLARACHEALGVMERRCRHLRVILEGGER